MLDVVLRSDEIKREGARWPLVKNVFVKYETIFDKSGNLIYSASGFSVDIEFTASLEEEIGEKRMSLFVRSGLDSDEVASPDDFTPKDTLYGIRSYGGNEWWQGDEAVVEANKKKYLKSRQ